MWNYFLLTLRAGTHKISEMTHLASLHCTNIAFPSHNWHQDSPGVLLSVCYQLLFQPNQTTDKFSKLQSPRVEADSKSLCYRYPRFWPGYLFYFIIINMKVGVCSFPTAMSFSFNGNLIHMNQIAITRALSVPQGSEGVELLTRAYEKSIQKPHSCCQKARKSVWKFSYQIAVRGSTVHSGKGWGRGKGITELEWAEVRGDHRYSCWLSLSSQQPVCPFLMCSDTETCQSQ